MEAAILVGRSGMQ
jgi:hypothetical protein